MTRWPERATESFKLDGHGAEGHSLVCDHHGARDYGSHGARDYRGHGHGHCSLSYDLPVTPSRSHFGSESAPARLRLGGSVPLTVGPGTSRTPAGGRGYESERLSRLQPQAACRAQPANRACGPGRPRRRCHRDRPMILRLGIMSTPLPRGKS